MAVDYIALFGEDFEDVLTALSQSYSPEIESMFLGIIDRMVYDVDIFSSSIEKSVQTMLSNGMAEDLIKETLENDMASGGAIFGKLRNDIKGSVVEANNQTARLGQYQQYFEKYDEKSLFVWISVTGHKICPDCQDRAAMGAMTFEEWEAYGLPASGQTVCRGYCYCVLDPVGKLDKDVKVGPKIIGPQPFKPITNIQAKLLAQRFIVMAKKLEEELSALVRKQAKESGTHLHGMKYRLKGLGSTKRKILKETEDWMIDYNQMSRENFSDINRYTFILDDVKYVDEYKKIIAGMEADGYQIHKVKNYWDGDVYKGLNVNLKAPDGRIIELQFNTSSQQYVKDKYSHALYEEFREKATPQWRKDILEKELIKVWKNQNKPVGWNTISNYP